MRRARYLLDSDAAADHLRSTRPVTDRVVRHIAECAIAAITLAELVYGAACSQKPVENRAQVWAFVNAVPVLPIDWAVAAQFGRVKAHLRSRGQLIADFDFIIAATALAHDLTLVTSNLSHYERIPDLRIESWRAAAV